MKEVEYEIHDLWYDFYTASVFLKEICEGKPVRLRNWIIFFSVASLWGSNWSVMKMGLSYVSPLVFVLQRFLFSAVVLSPVPLLLHKKIPRDRVTLCNLLILCLIDALGVTVTNIGLVGESSGIGAVLTYTQPLFVFCLAIPFLKERVTATKLLGTVIGFVGVAILFLGRIGSFTFNSTLALILGAFLWAVTIVYYKGFLSHVDPFITSFFQLSIGVLPLAILTLITGDFTFPGDPTYLGIILYASVGASAIGWTGWTFLIKEEDATVLAGSSFIVPLMALIFGWQLLGETIHTESILGSALILIGVYLVNLEGQRRRNQKGPS